MGDNQPTLQQQEDAAAIDIDQVTLQSGLVETEQVALPMSRRRKVILIYDDPKNIKNVFDWSVENVFRPGKDYVTILDTFTSDPASKGLSLNELWNLTAGTDDVEEVEIKIKKEKEIVDEHIDKLRHELSAHQILSQALTVSSNDPRAKVLEIVSSQKPELLVIGQSHLSLLQRTIYGSFEDYLTRHAECSVLVVKPAANPYQ